jgi:hypothetical protein
MILKYVSNGGNDNLSPSCMLDSEPYQICLKTFSLAQSNFWRFWIIKCCWTVGHCARGGGIISAPITCWETSEAEIFVDNDWVIFQRLCFARKCSVFGAYIVLSEIDSGSYSNCNFFFCSQSIFCETLASSNISGYHLSMGACCRRSVPVSVV